MQSIELLRREHALIGGVSACLDRAADSVAAGGGVDEELFLKALDFIGEFTHSVHRAKEEILSRVATARNLVETESRPCSDLLDFGGAVRRALPEASHGEPAARRLLSENAKAYVALIGSHVRARETLFEDVERVLTEADDRTLVALFEDAERRLGNGATERCRRLAGEIEALARAGGDRAAGGDT